MHELSEQRITFRTNYPNITVILILNFVDRKQAFYQNFVSDKILKIFVVFSFAWNRVLNYWYSGVTEFSFAVMDLEIIVWVYAEKLDFG